MSLLLSLIIHFWLMHPWWMNVLINLMTTNFWRLVCIYLYMLVGCMFANILFLVLNLADIALVLRLSGVKHVDSPHNLFFSLSRAVICRWCVSGMWQRGHRWRSYRHINTACRVWLSPPIVNTSSVWDTSTTWLSTSGPGRWLAIFVQLWKMAFI